MCGIAGFLSHSLGGADVMQSTVAAMAERMWRRGPDDQGEWVDAEAGVALGHRRLSIIDLSPGGSQPMESRCGRYVLTFNGELYNFRALRRELEDAGNVAWRGTSDTEVLVEAFAAWGVETALQRSNGMFALGVWDRRERALTLARDRLGEKPLYYGRVGDSFAFASEIGPLRVLAGRLGASLEIDREALGLLLQFQYIPAPWSIFRSIRKLPPACFVQVRDGEPGEPQNYWDLRKIVERGLAEPFEGSDEEAIDLVEAQLLRTVESRMESDVPLGAFLSGGVDSGLLVALMQQVSAKPVRTFTIGFDRAQNDESAEAAEIARHLGTDHTTLRVTGEQSLDVVPKLPTFYDEPFADASQIPTHLVSKLAREHVTVSISGDGGDEVFGGYMRYVWARRVGRGLRLVPGPLRSGLGRAMDAVPEPVWAAGFGAMRAVTPASLHLRSPVEKIRKIASLCQVSGMDQIYDDLTKAHWDATLAVLGLPEGWGHRLPKLPAGLDEPAGQMMFWDLLGYLPGDILTKVDRASMSVSLESRAPYLDHELIELAWRLPLNFKIRQGTKKWIAREILRRYVPDSMVNRPKNGFETPLFQWLRGPLREWADELLSEARLRREGYFNVDMIRRVWDDHHAGKARLHYELWSVLMFQQWLESST